MCYKNMHYHIQNHFLTHQLVTFQDFVTIAYNVEQAHNTYKKRSKATTAKPSGTKMPLQRVKIINYAQVTQKGKKIHEVLSNAKK